MTDSSRYRSDIDGLRAVAVLAVIIFHCQVGWVTGGFVGVDVFFVISGYLISGILIRALLAKQLSIPGFYVRRIFRIFPNLFLMVAFTGFASFFLLTPSQYGILGNSTRNVALFISNHFFLKMQNDYFEHTLASSQPLLHTWSLAVEEQYYILIPLILWMFARAEAANPLPALRKLFAGIFVLSFAVSAWLLVAAPGQSFYILPSRAWELMAGGLLALRPPEWKVSPRGATLLGYTGLAMILVCCLFYDDKTRFPGWNALLPVLGSALIILAGEFNAKGGVNRLLGTRPFVFIGLISYSLYLWHWPVLVLSKSVYWRAWDVGMPPIALQLLVIFALAYLSWRFIEQPTRGLVKLKHVYKAAFSFAAVVLGSTLLLGRMMSHVAEAQSPFAQPIPASLKNLAALQSAPYLKWSLEDSEQVDNAKGIIPIGDTSVPPDFIVIGDSFAGMWGGALDKFARERKKSGLLMSRRGCAPLVDIVRDKSKLCREVNNARFDYIAKSPIQKIVLAINWRFIKKDDGYSIWEKPGDEEVLKYTLEKTLAFLSRAGKKIFVVYPVPGTRIETKFATGADALTYALESMRSGNGPVYEYSRDKFYKEEQMHKFLTYLHDLNEKYPVTVIDPTEPLCQERGCLIADQGLPIYHDGEHVSDYGAERLVPVFAKLWAE